MMRGRFVAVCWVLFVAAAFCSSAYAQDPKTDVKGLFLLTDYPAMTLRPGSTSSINLKLQN